MAGLRPEAAVELITLRQAADDPKPTYETAPLIGMLFSIDAYES